MASTSLSAGDEIVTNTNFNISWHPEMIFRLMDCVYQSEVHIDCKKWALAECMFFNNDPDKRMAALYLKDKVKAGERIKAKYQELKKKVKAELGIDGRIGNLSAKSVDRPRWYGHLKLILDDVEVKRLDKDAKKEGEKALRMNLENITKQTLSAGLSTNPSSMTPTATFDVSSDTKDV